jgi:hypothetical protein
MAKAILTAGCLALLAAGCGGSNQRFTADQAAEYNLIQVGELYRHHQALKNRPPAKLADLNGVRVIGANAYEAVRSGKIVLRYGATLPDTGEEPGQTPSDEVLAYEKQVPVNGGKVLMLNRTVRTMTAEEFNAAPKAGKELPAPPEAKKKVR